MEENKKETGEPLTTMQLLIMDMDRVNKKNLDSNKRLWELLNKLHKQKDEIITFTNKQSEEGSLADLCNLINECEASAVHTREIIKKLEELL